MEYTELAITCLFYFSYVIDNVFINYNEANFGHPEFWRNILLRFVGTFAVQKIQNYLITKLC